MAATKKTSKRESRKKLAIRVLALVLAALMVLGVAYYLFIMLASPAMAETTYESAEVLNTSSLKTGGDVLVSVGLLYGNDVEVEFGVRTENGYTVGIQKLDGDKEFTEIWTLTENAISCLSDANIAKNNGLYSIAQQPSDTYIGGYHVQIDCDDLDREEFEALLSEVEAAMAGYGLNVIPAYIYTGYAVRIGDFSTWNEADVYVSAVASLYPTRVVSVVTPTKNAVSVIDSYTDRIIFEYDCGLNSVIGFKAHEDENGNTYMKTPAGNVYDGVFAFKRFIDDDDDGVSLINILPLEAYVAGVLPNEIPNTWPLETLKEFAITVRSFTLTHLNSKHSSYGFDLCNTTCCEVYRGAGRINNAVMTAVTDTRGMVICYEGDIVTSYYSSTVGGVTVSSADCWGGKEVPYLQAIETPWEDYMNHSNGFWISEVSPTELLERLHKAGYSELKGSVADVEIEELAKNSTYVKKLKVTDIYGTSITIVYTDRVRTSLTPYVNSANFVVGRGSVEYTESSVVNKIDPDTDSGGWGDTSDQADKSAGFTDTDGLHVLTSNSSGKIDYLGYVNILTSDGEVEFSRKSVFAVTAETADAYSGTGQSDTLGSVGASEIKDPANEGNDITVVYKTAYADDPDNFIFVGKGWGHGVGMSQWGCYDLAIKGYSYDEIIKAYFPNVTLVDYRTTNNFKEEIFE